MYYLLLFFGVISFLFLLAMRWPEQRQVRTRESRLPEEDTGPSTRR